jgi:hypothetical protein
MTGLFALCEQLLSSMHQILRSNSNTIKNNTLTQLYLVIWLIVHEDFIVIIPLIHILCFEQVHLLYYIPIIAFFPPFHPVFCGFHDTMFIYVMCMCNIIQSSLPSSTPSFSSPRPADSLLPVTVLNSCPKKSPYTLSEIINERTHYENQCGVPPKN